MGVITFNGIASNSKRFSVPILVEQPPTYTFPSRDAELTHIPGRSGDMLVDNGSYNNVTRTYNLVMASEEEDYVKLAYELSSWLHSANGYAMLTDTYDPEHYCMAAFIDEGSINNILNCAAKFSVSFNCKPQRYLVIGDHGELHGGLVQDSTVTVYNPTNMPAYPLIQIDGDFSNPNLKLEFEIFNERSDLYPQYSIEVLPNEYTVVSVDSELKDCYSRVEIPGSYTRIVVSANQYIKLPWNGFPVLNPGRNFIKLVTLENAESIGLGVTPRWWTL